MQARRALLAACPPAQRPQTPVVVGCLILSDIVTRTCAICEYPPLATPCRGYFCSLLNEHNTGNLARMNVPVPRTGIIQLYPLPHVYTVRSDLCEHLPTCGSAAIVRIQYQHEEKHTTGRISKDLGEKKVQYSIDFALNVITLTCFPLRLYAITPHHPPQSRPYEPSGQWPQHQSLPSASAAPPGPVPGH